MKKLGFLFTLALLTQYAAADKVGFSYSNAAMLVAETGASASWATKEILIAEQNTQKLEKSLQTANEKLALRMEQRFLERLESATNSDF